MNGSFLFAIDPTTEEIIISESPKGTNKVNFIERIHRRENDVFYNAVITLTSISKSPKIDVTIFKSMDKICQLIYSKHKESK